MLDVSSVVTEFTFLLLAVANMGTQRDRVQFTEFTFPFCLPAGAVAYLFTGYGSKTAQLKSMWGGAVRQD